MRGAPCRLVSRAIASIAADIDDHTSGAASWWIWFTWPFTGCAVDHAALDTQGAIEQALTGSSADIIVQRARELHPPMVKGVMLDPRQPLSPSEAAVLAGLIKPSLTALRDRIGGVERPNDR